MAPEPPPPVPLGARCASHPDAPAVATCARCGTFLCGTCLELREEAAYCGPCVDFLRQHGPPSRAVQACIVLGILGVVCLPFLFLPLFTAPAAGLCLWVSGKELRRIRQGERPLQGRTQARVARVLGLFNLVLLVLWGGLAVYLSSFRS